MIRDIYTAIEDSRICSHLVHDDDWAHVRMLTNIVNDMLRRKYDGFICLRKEVEGYSHNNMTKSYLMSVEDDLFGEQIIEGRINCHAAGRVNDVWSAYDMTASWWRYKE